MTRILVHWIYNEIKSSDRSTSHNPSARVLFPNPIFLFGFPSLVFLPLSSHQRKNLNQANRLHHSIQFISHTTATHWIDFRFSFAALLIRLRLHTTPNRRVQIFVAKRSSHTHDMKLLAVDIPMASGPDQRLFLIGDEEEYRIGGGLIAELRDPVVRAMAAIKEFEELDTVETTHGVLVEVQTCSDASTDLMNTR
ncbi:hypothetical protein Droror1_Dr00001303 [Drosera rotundifolia]